MKRQPNYSLPEMIRVPGVRGKRWSRNKAFRDDIDLEAGREFRPTHVIPIIPEERRPRRRSRHRSGLGDLRFSRRLAEVGIPHLCTPDPLREHPGETAKGFMVHLATLEQMNLH